MKKLLLFLALSIVHYPLSIYCGTNAAVTFNTNTFIVSPTNLWQSNAVPIQSALLAIGFSGGGGGITNYFDPAQMLTNGSGQVHVFSLPAPILGPFAVTNTNNANNARFDTNANLTTTGNINAGSNITATGTVTAATVFGTTYSGGTMGLAGTITGNLFSGSGASLTGLPAANLTGTINIARLPAIIPIANLPVSVSGLTNLPYAATNVLFVSTTGNDATAQRGTLRSFLTVSNAAQNAQYGDIIYVAPGTYFAGTNLAVNGVTWQFAGPSCVISNFALNANPASTNAIFSDVNGVTNIIVLGYPTLIYNTGTDYFGNLDGHGNPLFCGASNASAAILLTNANTVATLKISDVQFSTFQSAFAETAVQINACSNVNAEIYTFEEPSFGATITFTNGGHSRTCGGSASAFVWGTGNVWFNFHRIGLFEKYGIWCDEPTPAGFTNNLYCAGTEINSQIYVSAVDNSYRSWFNINWINTSNASGGYSALFFGGYNYLNAQKVSDSVVGCISLSVGATLWLTAEKLESPSKWINVDNTTNPITGAANVLYASVLQYADAGAVNNGINIQAGTNFFEGGDAVVNNGVAVNFSGGVAVFKHTTLDTKATVATNNWPVWTTASGLILNDCALIAPAGAYSMFSGQTAVNVALHTSSYFNTPIWTNITLIGTNQSAVLAGNGASITNLNASSVTSGTLPLAQLNAAVVTNTEPAVTLPGATLNATTFAGGTNTLTGDIAYPAAAITSLANGENGDVPIGTNRFIIYTGNTGAISIDGFVASRDGREFTAVFPGSSPLTIRNLSGLEATAANRIITSYGQDVTLSNNPVVVRFHYQASSNAWIIQNFNSIVPAVLPASIPETNIAWSIPVFTNFGTLAFATYYTNTWNRISEVSVNISMPSAGSYQDAVYLFDTNAVNAGITIPARYANPRGATGGAQHTITFKLYPWQYFSVTNLDSAASSLGTNSVELE